MAQRRQYSGQFQAKIVLQALKGHRTINEITSAHGVHPVQLTQWKKQALEELSQVFADRRGREASAMEEEKSRLALLDWFSHYVLSWELLPTLGTGFCLRALARALRGSSPEIFNTDQGSQFTSEAFTDRLEKAGVAISMDGRERALDNVSVERLWRTVKYEEVYLKDYAGFGDMTE